MVSMPVIAIVCHLSYRFVRSDRLVGRFKIHLFLAQNEAISHDLPL